MGCKDTSKSGICYRKERWDMEEQYFTGCRLSKADIRDYKIKAAGIETDNLPKEFILKLN